MDSTPWIEKYRPKSVLQVCAQEETTTILHKTISTKNLPHLLLYGPAGTGKTSTILALARELYGHEGFKQRVLELNASDERGIDVIREKVKNFARVSVNNASDGAPPYKIIVLDEADSLTADAQSALRRIIENYSKVTRFCLICNYVSRIIEPLASRCAKFRFKPISLDSVEERLRFICDEESVVYDKDALKALAVTCNGDLRRAITLLQSLKRASLNAPITKALVAEISGAIPQDVLQPIISAWTTNNNGLVEKELKKMVQAGFSGTIFLQQLSNFIATDPHISQKQKCGTAILMTQTDKALLDGADEQLQLLSLLLKSMVY